MFPKNTGGWEYTAFELLEITPPATATWCCAIDGLIYYLTGAQVRSEAPGALGSGS